MSSFLSENLSIEGKGLRYKLTIIAFLMSILPFFAFSGILYKEQLFFEFDNFYAISVVFLLLLSLAGMIILRQIFDNFIMLTLYMQKAEAGETIKMEVVKETAELHEMTVAFNNIMKRLEQTGNRLEDQTSKLKQAITERIQLAGKLWESENMYSELVENISEAVFIVDRNGMLTYVSPAFEQVSGYTPEEATGRLFKEFIYQDDRSSVTEGFHRVISGASEPAVFRLLSKSGAVHWIHSFNKPILTGEEIVGIQGILTDITDYRETKKAYRETEKRLEQKTYEVERLSKIVADNEVKIEALKRVAERFQSRIKELEGK